MPHIYAQAMVKINELSASMTPQNFNQMTRWVNTKEEHCGKIIHLMGDYCLCQRIKKDKLSDKDYVDALKAHHAVMVAAMKAKQSVDAKGVAGNLKHVADDWAKIYTPVEK